MALILLISINRVASTSRFLGATINSAWEKQLTYLLAVLDYIGEKTKGNKATYYA